MTPDNTTASASVADHPARPAVEAMGGWWFPDRLSAATGVAFACGSIEGPNCACNDKAPPFHVYLYPARRFGTMDVAANVEVRSFGQAGGEDGPWLHLKVTSLDDVTPENFERVRAAMGAAWAAFCGAMEATP